MEKGEVVIDNQHFIEENKGLQKRLESVKFENEKLKQLLISNEIAVLIQDLDLRYIECYGYDVAKNCGYDDILGKADSDFKFCEEHERWVKTKAHVIESGEPARSIFKKKDGALEYVFSVIIEPRYDGDGEVNGVINSIMDVTESSIFERSLRESENRYRLLFNSFQAAISFWSTDYKFILANDYNLMILGATSISELADKHIRDIFPQKAEVLVERFRNIKKTKTRASYEDCFYLPNGNMWFDSIIEPVFDGKSNLVGFQIVAIDITDKKMVEQELLKQKDLAEQNQARYKLLYNSIRESVVFFDTEYKVQLCNEATEIMFGKDQDELMGTYVSDFVPQIADIAIARFEKAKQLGVGGTYLDHVERPEGDKWFEISVQPVFIKDKKLIGFQVSANDITHKKRNSEELIRQKERAEISEDRYKTLYNSFNAAVTFWNKDYELVLSNEFNQNLFETKLDLIKGKHISQLFPNHSRIFVERLAYIKATGLGQTYEDCFNLPNGKMWLHTMVEPVFESKSNQLMGFQMVATDITKKKNAEQKVLEQRRLIEASEHKHRFLFDNLDAAITFWNTDYKLVMANKNSLAGLEVSEEDVLGIHISEMFPGKAEELIHRFESTKLTREGISYVDSFPMPLGNLWFHGFVQPYYDINEKLQGYQIVGINITELMMAKEELLKQKEIAEENSRLKTAFLQNISHEIGTPIHAISMFSGFLEKENLPKEKLNYFIDIIQENTKQLSHIVTNFFMASTLFENGGVLEIEVVSINEKLERLKSIFEEKAKGKNIQLQLHKGLNDHESKVYIDNTKLNQVLTNLLSNAIKFTDNGVVEFGYHLNNGRLEFFVKDTGMGIKKAHQKKIFERFDQGDISIGKKYGGTGLGLSIVKSLVSLLKGEIRLKSVYGRGTTFFIDLPYDPMSLDTSPTDENGTEKEDKILLIVDDAYHNYVIVEELLADMGIHLLYAKHGREAIDICDKNDKIDLVLMDIKMPIMDGYEAASRIKEKLPQLPIIAQSAYDSDADIESKVNHFDGYLQKPFEQDEFNRTLAAFLEE